MNEILKLSPECIWRNFYSLTQVPRPSGHLEKVQAFLLDFAAKAGVEAFKDPAGNIVMRKPATPGMENRKGVILQAHMDMVPQKTPGEHPQLRDRPHPALDRRRVGEGQGHHPGCRQRHGRGRHHGRDGRRKT